MEEEEPKCTICDRPGVTLTKEGICLSCLAKKYDDDDSSWMNKA